MSFYDDASLMLLASGGAQKDGKVYSVKPTDGTGDFTFSRGSNLSATRVDGDGLIEKGRENLLLQSNSFNNWISSNTTETSGQSGYDGSSDAWLLNKSAANARVYQNLTTSGVQTFSVYAKAGTSSWIRVLANTSSFNGGYFDLANGVTGDVENAIDTTIESVGNGWYRCSVIFNGNTTRVRIYPAEANSSSASSGNILIQDSQLEIGLAATEVIETGASTAQAGILEDTPRFDYLGATCPSLLLEPSRTNLVTQSEYIDSWSKAGSLTISTNNDTSPEGIQNASLILPNAVSGTFGVINSISKSASSLTYTLSGFAKAKDYNFLILRIDSGAASGVKGAFDLSDGTISTAFSTNGTGFTFIDADIKAYANNWYKYEVSFTTDSLTLLRSIFYVSNVTGNGFSVPGYAANGTDGILFWGAQVEEATYPTSYIPTYGVSQTRAQDICGGAGDAATFNDSEGVLYAEIAALANDGTFRGLTISANGSASDRITITINSNIDSIRAIIKSNNATSFDESYNSVDVLSNTKIAVKYAQDNFALFINGVKRFSDTSGNTPIGLDVLNFNAGSTAIPFNGKAKQVIVFPTALSDADLTTLTTL